MQAHSVQRYSDDQGSLEVLYGVHIHLVVEGLGQICWSLGDAVCGRLWPFTDGGERLRLLTLNGAADWERWNTHRLPIGWLWVERLSIWYERFLLAAYEQNTCLTCVGASGRVWVWSLQGVELRSSSHLPPKGTRDSSVRIAQSHI